MNVNFNAEHIIMHIVVVSIHPEDSYEASLKTGLPLVKLSSYYHNHGWEIEIANTKPCVFYNDWIVNQISSFGIRSIFSASNIEKIKELESLNLPTLSNSLFFHTRNIYSVDWDLLKSFNSNIYIIVKSAFHSKYLKLAKLLGSLHTEEDPHILKTRVKGYINQIKRLNAKSNNDNKNIMKHDECKT